MYFALSQTPPAQNILDRHRRLGGPTVTRRHLDLEIADGQDIQNPSRHPDLLSRMGHHHRAPAATASCGAGAQPRRHDAQTTTHPRRGPHSPNPRRTRTQRRLRRRTEQTTTVLTADSRLPVSSQQVLCGCCNTEVMMSTSNVALAAAIGVLAATGSVIAAPAANADCKPGNTCWGALAVSTRTGQGTIVTNAGSLQKARGQLRLAVQCRRHHERLSGHPIGTGLFLARGEQRREDGLRANRAHPGSG